jgi:molybdenum cofactor biosynthesis enzyme
VAEPYSRLLVPRVDNPSLNVTVPVVTEAAEITVAVKVTDALNSDGLELDETAVVVAALFTVWVMAGEVDDP